MKNVKLNMYLKENLGDDLFLKIILERYPNTIFHIQSNINYKNTFLKKYKNVKIYYGIKNKIINFIYLITRQNKKMFHYIKNKCDLMITLGGSMFIEKGKTKELLKQELDSLYLNDNKPYYIIGSNFGPYHNNYYKKLYENIFKKACTVNFREEYSYNLFKNLDNVKFYPDVVFSLDTDDITIKNRKEVAISIMDIKKELYYEKMIEIINYFLGKKYKINLISFCKYEGDEKAIKKIMNKLDNKKNINIYCYKGNINEVLNVIAKSRIVIASRFHASILGLLFNKTVIPIAYSNKTLNVLNDLKFKGKIIDINKIEEFNVCDLTEEDLNYKLNIDKCIINSHKHFKELDKILR